MRTYLNTRILEPIIAYDGSQLSPHWNYRVYGIEGNSLVAFCGPANVSVDNMVDLEDVKKQAPIRSPKMLHFIGEWFIDSFEEGILLQHLFVHTVREALWEKGITRLSRRGNDIFFEQRKLSVSICAKATTSVLMHTGLNIDTHGTPIPTSGLSEMRIDPLPFAKDILELFVNDSKTWARARWKALGR